MLVPQDLSPFDLAWRGKTLYIEILSQLGPVQVNTPLPSDAYIPRGPRQIAPAASQSLECRRLRAVKTAMRDSWGAYVKYAWGQDELLPISGQGTQAFCNTGALSRPIKQQPNCMSGLCS